jgi:DNA-binding response OmpR family regulator
MAENALHLALAAGLSKSQMAVFACLVARPGALVSRAEILAALKANAPHTIDSHIMEIRRKLERLGNGTTIETVKGSGFILHLG